jgi:murein L,D-transpeptidase YcbB/YkuD
MGQSTKDWMNISYGEKAQMIADGVKNLRQSPIRSADRYVRINIPQYLLEYYNEGKVQRVHRVIVGKASGKKVNLQGRIVGENQTPPLASQIERIIINPRWYVTDRIRRELGDSVAADPKYVQMSSTFASGAPRLYQLPGPTNPLGRFKFEFPNAYAVFLHDTPKRQLFYNPRRDFSHGCVRVENAQELAARLLADDENPAVNRIDTFLASNRPSHVQLSQSVPIVIEYQPVSTNGKGQVIFYGDPYGLFRESTVAKATKAS